MTRCGVRGFDIAGKKAHKAARWRYGRKRENGLNAHLATETQSPPHGGDLDRAQALYGGAAAEWLDLSTGINAESCPAPVPPADDPLWRRLPDQALLARAVAAARTAYGVSERARVLPAPGAQGALQLAPRLLKPGRVAILSPTYAEHARAFRAAGWMVMPTCDVETLARLEADAAVVVTPNNPDGRRVDPERLLALSERLRLLVVDESFMDETPERSLAPRAGGESLLVLRSLGKFYGLAGLRLGFALAGPRFGATLAAALGPWPVSGAALSMGAAALENTAWAARTRARLAENGPRLDRIAAAADLALIGGTGFFRSYRAGALWGGAARTLQAALARKRIWTRVFPELPSWIRFGAPGPEADWARLETALFDAAAERGATL